jgi:hypothetical protein
MSAEAGTRSPLAEEQCRICRSWDIGTRAPGPKRRRLPSDHGSGASASGFPDSARAWSFGRDFVDGRAHPNSSQLTRSCPQSWMPSAPQPGCVGPVRALRFGDQFTLPFCHLDAGADHRAQHHVPPRTCRRFPTYPNYQNSNRSTARSSLPKPSIPLRTWPLMGHRGRPKRTPPS